MIIITIWNLKGGTGKTTTTFNLAANYAKEGKRVLLVDLDMQANLTSFFDDDIVKHKENKPDIASILSGASLTEEEQREVLSSGAIKTNEIKKAVTELKEPMSTDIELAFKNLISNYKPNYGLAENYFKEHFGKTYARCRKDKLNFDCNPKGIIINGNKEITWHNFVMRAKELGLFNSEEINTSKEPDKVNSEQQLPGQDNIYNHPEYLPDKDIENEKLDVTESVTFNNKVINYRNTDNLTGVQVIGKCPHCNAPLALLTNKKFCGNCGKHILWN